MSYEIVETPSGRTIVPQWAAEYAGLESERFAHGMPGLHVRGARLMVWQDGRMEIIDSGVLTVQEGRIAYVGPKKGAPSPGKDDVIIDAEGRLVTPGLIDPHTHLIFAGERAKEFEMRLKGASYEEILRAGGGILSTVQATRGAEEDQLIALAKERLDEELMRGVTTVEAKTGYFLERDGELKALKLYGELSMVHPIRIAPTLLSAHVVPKEYAGKADEYVRVIAEEIIPEAARVRDVRTRIPTSQDEPYHFHTFHGEPMPHWAVDVFCERSAFDLKQTETILESAKRHGFDTKLHAGQFSAMGAAGLGAKMGALSVDHMEFWTDEELDSIAEAGTVVTFLPGAAYSLRMEPPKMEPFRERGIPVALATDLNPGTSMTTHLPLMMSMGAQLCGMTVEEAWRAVTINAARALGMEGMIGELREGAIADLVVWHFEEPAEPFWRLGEGYPWLVVREGVVVWEN